MLKKISSLAFVVLLLFVIAACTDPIVEDPMTIVDVAVDNGSFETLVAARPKLN